jgi:nitroreductase
MSMNTGLARGRLMRGRVEFVSDAGDRLLHPLLVARSSPTTFDGSARISMAEIESLLEAARWAPSAGNSQPWAFIVGRRGEAVHDRLVRHLAGSSAAWAPSAGLLLANLSHRFVEDTDWDYSEFSVYDLGQAVAHMTFQAQSLGLSVRQFRAFDRDALAAEFQVPPHWEVTTMSAIGRVPAELSPPEATTANVARMSRDRRPLTDVHWPQAASGRR